MNDLDAFIDAVENNQSLQSEIKAVTKPEEIVKIAKSNNYQFSLRDLKTAMLEKMNLFNLLLNLHDI